jgi:phosphatidylglycerophosphate synthase
MANDHANETHQGLREQLQAAEAGGGSGAGMSRQATAFGGRLALLVGILVALYMLTVVYIYPQHNPWLTTASTLAFVVGIVGTVRWHEARRRASSPGWSKRYSLAFAISAGLFGLGVALLDMTDIRAWWLWVPYALLTALPLATIRIWPGAK